MKPHTFPVEEFASDQADKWSADAQRLCRLGFRAQARIALAFAEELRQAAEEWSDRTLTLRESCEISGLAYSTLQAMVRQGKLPNAGERGSPRVRRRDLPWRPDKRSTVPFFCPGSEPVLDGEEDPLLALLEDELRAMEPRETDPLVDLPGGSGGEDGAAGEWVAHRGKKT